MLQYLNMKCTTLVSFSHSRGRFRSNHFTTTPFSISICTDTKGCGKDKKHIYIWWTTFKFMGGKQKKQAHTFPATASNFPVLMVLFHIGCCPKESWNKMNPTNYQQFKCKVLISNLIDIYREREEILIKHTGSSIGLASQVQVQWTHSVCDLQASWMIGQKNENSDIKCTNVSY